jgi:hypothetical protein
MTTRGRSTERAAIRRVSARSRRVLTLVSIVTGLMMVAGPAFAHFCYIADRSEQGNRGAANSQAWVSIEHILVDEIGLCDAGLDYFDEVYLAPRGLTPATLLHGRALLAAPHFGTPKMSDGRGVDHLFNSEQDLIELDEAIEGAFEVCFGGGA